MSAPHRGGVGQFLMAEMGQFSVAVDTGSAFFAEIVAELSQFRWLGGESQIRLYESPVRDSPPGYRRTFCASCGSPVPTVHAERGLVSIPAGSLDDDPEVRPMRHIFVDRKAAWFGIEDTLPQVAGGIRRQPG
ncbi:GFA family protein [Pendulispora albinea]|uniref:GFA family protein n=1 Tax=Pendulispora albinea TaxID=2741071 RepID=A0ABZ2M882_9BACT